MKTGDKLTIGLFGFGVVGQGIYEVLQQSLSLNVNIKKICIKEPGKKREAPADLFTTDYEDLLSDPEINVIVELINDAGEAFKIVSTALKNGKAVVTANKKMVAEHLAELLQLQQEYDTPFLYEASVCGSIPIIRNLEEYYDNDLLKSICGIVNGSTNFILTKMIDEQMPYPKALEKAQFLGFAETDPSLDVLGIDAVNKLTILIAHAYGVVTHPQRLLHVGIDRLNPFDAKTAEEKDFVIKLIAQAIKLANGKIAAFVLPHYIDKSSQLYAVKDEFNGVVIQSSLADKQFLYGKGAGRYPTASAVLSDISALRYAYRYEYHKLNTHAEITDDFYLRIYCSFEKITQIDLKDFEWVEEFHSQEVRQYLIGVIQFKKLIASNWFNKKIISVIVCPDGVIEEIDTRKVKKLSHLLAGSHFVEKTSETLSNLPKELSGI
jgi:homoserine dehydrogenase